MFMFYNVYTNKCLTIEMYTTRHYEVTYKRYIIVKYNNSEYYHDMQFVLYGFFYYYYAIKINNLKFVFLFTTEAKQSIYLITKKKCIIKFNVKQKITMI